MTRTWAPGVVFALAALAAACSRGGSAPEPAPDPPENRPASSSGPAPGADGATDPSLDAGSRSAVPAVVVAPPAASVHPGGPTCGNSPLPPCPLNAWMKANTSRAMNAQDFGGLAAALDRVVTFAPPDYVNWASIARDGASAARGENLEAVRAACRGCHRQYKDKYKQEMRDRPL